jgi:hypothetical protein
MKRKALSLLLIVMLYISAGATDPLTISKTTIPPKIDGVIDSNDPWSSNWISMTKNWSENTTSDISGKFQLTYDRENLYLVAVCVGDKSVDTSCCGGPFYNDGIGIYIMMGNVICNTCIYLDGDYEFIMRRGSVFPDRFYSYKYYCDWNKSNFKIGQADNSTFYTQEWQMPWAILADDSFLMRGWDSTYLKLELQFLDNTTGEMSGITQRLNWNDYVKDPLTNGKNYGLVILKTPPDTRLSQTISFDPITNKKIEDDDFLPSARSSSGLQVYFTCSNHYVATIVDNKVHIVGNGTCQIVAHQDGNDVYKPAKLVTQNLTVTISNQSYHLNISMIDKLPKIDGIIDNNDPWTTTWINMKNNYGSNTTSDVTGKFQLTYNENNLYLAVVSTGDKSLDTSSEDIPNSYESDCIEVFILMDTTRENDYYKPGDYQFRMRRGSVFPDRFDPGQLYNNWRNSDFKIGQTNVGTSYTQEWQMPWAVLADSAGMSPAWDGTTFRFDIKISDNTTGAGSGRTQQLFWSQLLEYSWRNIQYYGWIKLLTTAVKTAKLKEKTIYLNPVNNKLRINAEISEQSIIEIFNIEGKQILTAKITRDKTVDVGFLKAGAYILKIVDGKEIYSGKFIKR